LAYETPKIGSGGFVWYPYSVIQIRLLPYRLVSWRTRKNPRVDLMLWFLLKDEPNLSGWQSGLITYSGKKKPSFAAFEQLTP
jgi:hypothetical protein